MKTSYFNNQGDRIRGNFGPWQGDSDRFHCKTIQINFDVVEQNG